MRGIANFMNNRLAWILLRAEILKKIKEIDNSTPWGEREPKWWLDMMEIERQLNKQSKKYD